MFDLYADVVFRLPLERSYTYLVPPDLVGRIVTGMRVNVEINGRLEDGIVVAVHSTPPPVDPLLILELPDQEAIVCNEQIELSSWMSEQFLCGPGEALFKMFPNGGKMKVSKPPVKGGGEPRFSLNEEQQEIYDAIQESETGTHLVHGVTGSGKTELYIHLIHRFLAKQKGVILLVPEISLTVQLIRRLEEVFGDELALMHSALKPSLRFHSYLSVLRGERKIVVGTRSAVFAPVRDLGLVIIDEEHDSSYREHSTPRYDARMIAHKRCEDVNGLLVLGSATPRIETCYRAMRPEIRSIDYHRLTKRATGASLPEVRIIEAPPGDIPVSGTLLREIELNIKRNEQTILLLNRRGYSPYRYCPSCETSILCKNCSVTLTLHKNGKLICHYCGFTKHDTGTCEECGSATRQMGSGTQKLEEYLLNLYPSIRLERLDTDSAMGSQGVTGCIDRLVAGEIDLLVGTQMIAKGLDVANVTLVGVLQADGGLAMPDFRASERTFSLLTQVAGRAGRGEKKGRVYFEAINPGHPILHYAAAQNYDPFFQEEIRHRHEAYYPPFCRLIRILFRSESDGIARDEASRFVDRMERHRDRFSGDDGKIHTIVLGPAVAPFEKLHNKYRHHVIIKTAKMNELREILKLELAEIRKKLKQDCYMEIDFDAFDLL